MKITYINYFTEHSFKTIQFIFFCLVPTNQSGLIDHSINRKINKYK